MYIKYCIKCGRKVSRYKEYCRKCAGIMRRKPKNKCIDCGQEITKRSKRCKLCQNKNQCKPVPHCKNCNKELVNRTAKICGICRYKEGGKRLIKYRKDLSEKERNSFYRKRFHFSINKTEKYLLKIIQNLNIGFEFVGDGKTFIAGKCPDFIDFKQKKIIELFGDYWHNRDEMKEKDNQRLKIYKKYGYKTLIIWEHELKDINRTESKILTFNRS